MSGRAIGRMITVVALTAACGPQRDLAPTGVSMDTRDDGTGADARDGGPDVLDEGSASDVAAELDAEARDETDAALEPDDAVPTREPVELMVYTANVENLPKTADPCPGDWKDLFAYMAIQTDKPDILLVQQVTNQTQLDELTDYMTVNLGRPYEGFVAEADPVPFNSPCGAQKAQQTNAIVYAGDRLQPVSSPSIWRSYKNVDGTCSLDQLSRTRSIAVEFLDLRSDELVSAASIHWSTRNGPGADPACAAANARETDRVLRENHPDATLYLFGGDTNEPDTEQATYNPWYTMTNGGLGGTLGYVDPIWSRCDGEGDLRQCLLTNWTFSGASRRRIDFLFARTAAPTILDAHTVTFNEGDAADLQITGTDNASQNYSDHRAVVMQLTY